jgi:hypothetical protein
MAQQRYANTVPFGKCTVSAPGTTTPLSVNCGPLGGQVASQTNPLPVSGTACQQFTLQADAGNGGNLYLMPRGATFAANPGLILAQLPPGASIPFPFSAGGGPGLVPENFVMDSDLGVCVFYGYGVLVG